MIKFPLLYIESTEQTIKEKTIAKWKAIGMLDGLYDMKKQMIKFPLLKERECYDHNIALPFMRRSFASMFSGELVSVQSMSAPNPDVYLYIQPPVESINVNITLTNNENN
jgi:hypothetical protein